MIRAIIFDCFGVLYVPTTSIYFDRFPEIREELHDLNKLSDYGFIGREEYITKVCDLTGIDKEETLRELTHEYTINQPLIDYIRTDLKPLYKIALLSNIGHEWMSDFFDEHQLHDLFDVVVMSSIERIAKPNPLIYERTAERLGVLPSECVMIDDLGQNCEGAKRADMQALLFKPGFTHRDIQAFISEEVSHA